MQAANYEYRIADTNDRIPPTMVQEFSIRSSIHTSYPVGELLIQDPEGRLLSDLMIRPGSILQITAIDNTDGFVGNTYPLAPMVIVGIENAEDDTDLHLVTLNSELDSRTGALGGYVRVHLAHPWGIFTSWRNQGYTKTPISDIVRSLIDDPARGFSFEHVDIGSTDDGTDGPNRYKLQESEAAFIARKLLPYATIDSSAVYSFVNERHEFFFQSFKYLYDQDATISIVPAVSELTQAGAAMNLQDLENIHHLSEGRWFIGNQFKEQLGTIKKLMYVDDSESHLSYRILAAYHASLPGYSLLKKGFVDSTLALASEVYPFRSFADSVRLSLNRNSIMNEFFEISVTTTPCFEVGAVGYPAQLRLVESNPNRSHWANGKWLITQSEHGMRNGEKFSKLRLSRPAVDSLPGDLNAEEFYKLSKG